jgi:hypothetical protein
MALLILAPPLAWGQSSGNRGCEADISSLRRVAVQTTVEVAVRPSLRVGEGIEVKWHLSGVQPSAPMFLVLAMPDAARFTGIYDKIKIKSRFREDEEDEEIKGPYFLAVPANVGGPAAIEFRRQRLRAFVPVRHEKMKQSGSLWIKPLKAGTFDLEWTVVARTPCGEHVLLPLRKREFAVAAGKPELVVQDTTALQAPDRPALAQRGNDKSRGVIVANEAHGGVSAQIESRRVEKIIHSNSRQYVLHIHADSYVVFDAVSGAMLVDRPGFDPNFSPASRFIAAKIGDRGDNEALMEIVDLLTGQPIGITTGPILGWSHGDSVLYAGMIELKQFQIIWPLVDEHNSNDGHLQSIFLMGMGREADSWNHRRFFLSIDKAVFLLPEDLGDELQSIDLYSREVRGFADEREFQGFVTHELGLRNFRFANRWMADSKIGLSHVCSYCDGKEARGDFGSDQKQPYQRDFLVQHAPAGSQQPRASAGSSILPRAAWAASRALAVIGEADRDFTARLAELGITVERANRLQPQQGEPGEDNYFFHWPEGLLERFLAAFDHDFGEHSPHCFVGHWTIRHRDRTVHLLQHCVPSTAGWASPKAEVVTFDEVDGQFRNLRFHHDLMGPKLPDRDRRGMFPKYFKTAKVKLRVSVSGDRVLIGSPSFDTLGILNLETDEMTLLYNSRHSDLTSDLMLTSDRRTILQLNTDGQFFFYDIDSGRHLLSGRDIDGEIIVYDQNGYYTATYEGAHFMHLRFPGETGLHSFQQFATTLNRPDIIKAALEEQPRRSALPDLVPPPILDAQLATGGAAPSLKVTARSGDELKAVRIYQDGHLTDDIAVSGRESARVIPIKRLKNARWITVVAVDKRGYFSKPATVQNAVAGSQGGVLRAVTVGIDRYDSADLPHLRFAVDDATDIANVVERNSARYYGQVVTTRLADATTSPGKITEALKRAVSTAQAGDTVMFFFAGHGVRDRDGAFYLATTKSDPAGFKNTALAWTTIASILQKSKARVIVLLDACHSGLAGKETSATNDEAVAQIMSGGQAPMLVFSASKGRQTSLEQASLRNGVFTHALKQAIGADRRRHDLNGNGAIEISELYRAVKGIVTEATGGAQSPWLARYDLIGDFVLF